MENVSAIVRPLYEKLLITASAVDEQMVQGGNQVQKGLMYMLSGGKMVSRIMSSGEADVVYYHSPRSLMLLDR